MNTNHFIAAFETYFPKHEIGKVSTHFEDKFTRSFFDPCFTVEGMTSIKKQMLLKIAFSCLFEDECYLEIGTYTGKSLISALKNNVSRKCYACDNFSQFTDSNSLEILINNLAQYSVRDKIIFFNSDYRSILLKDKIKEPVGLYFYDGAHDRENQYMAIKLVEPLLADIALVIIDDWRFARDSQSYAKAATEQAISESKRHWQLLYDLPARYNGDHAMWWNGVAVFESRI